MTDTEKETVVEETPVEDNNKVDELQKLVEQQSELINKLIKQTEVTNKVNKQLTENIIEKTKEAATPVNPFEWVEKKLKNFSPEGINPMHYDQQKLIGGALNEKGLEFYLNYLKKSEKLEAEELANRMNRVMQNMHNY